MGEHRGLLLQSRTRSVKARGADGHFAHAAHQYTRNTVVRQEVTCYDHQLTRCPSGGRRVSTEGVPPLTGDRSPLEAPPRAFGSYLVRTDLGFGRFGPIFLAEDPASGRRGVVRLFSRRFSDQQRSALLAALETLCARPLDHPSIAAPLASGVAGADAADAIAHDVYVVHAYLPGTPIEGVVAKQGAQTLADLLPLVTHAAAAIDFAAAAGVHHGALTGRDVIVTPERTAISGFGLVQALVAAGVGPEAPSHADDVRALAVIALEALCACEFSTIDVAATVMSLPGAVPHRLLDAFEAALSPYPDLRPKTALDFAARLQQAIADVPAPSVDHAASGTRATAHGDRHDGDRHAVTGTTVTGDTLRRDWDATAGTLFVRPHAGAAEESLPPFLLELRRPEQADAATATTPGDETSDRTSDDTAAFRSRRSTFRSVPTRSRPRPPTTGC